MHTSRDVFNTCTVFDSYDGCFMHMGKKYLSRKYVENAHTNTLHLRTLHFPDHCIPFSQCSLMSKHFPVQHSSIFVLPALVIS